MKTFVDEWTDDTKRCKAMSHSIDHVVTRKAKLWVALRRSGLAMRAANKIFMSTLEAMGWRRPGVSLSSSVGRAIPASVNGVAAFGNCSFLTFASSQ